MSVAKILKKVRDAEERIFDTKFCSSCQSMQPKDTGKYVSTNTSKRWKCAKCLKKMKEAKRRIKHNR